MLNTVIPNNKRQPMPSFLSIFYNKNNDKTPNTIKITPAGT